MRAAASILISILIFGTHILNAQMDSVLVDGGFRYYFTHLPDGFDPAEEYALILGFHGGFGNAEQFEGQSLLSEKADEAGFIAVYPQGTGYLLAPNLRFWNAGGCCAYAMENDLDDVGFVDELIDQLISELPIDSNRVYSTGISNGAMMSYRLACELSERIAAIAPVAGSMLTETCEPTRGVPVIHFHSYLDTNAPMEGGYGDKFDGHYNPPVDSVLNAWANHGDCQVLNDTIYEGGDYTEILWNECDCGYELREVLSEDGGHSWPGGVATALGDPASEYVNANDRMWDFFLDHSLDCEDPTNLEPEFIQGPDVNAYPNPSQGSFVIVSKHSGLHVDVDIWTTDGKRVAHQSGMLPVSFNGVALSPDIYIVQITSESFCVQKRLVICR